jgi:flagellar biosynthetic protein FlhB
MAKPIHDVMALRYVREEGGAPLVLSKGKELIAVKIREIAVQHSTPIIEDKHLARSMDVRVEVDRAIRLNFIKR